MNPENPLNQPPDPLALSAANQLKQPYTQGLDGGPAFYVRTSKAIVALCGHEADSSDFRAVVDLLDTQLQLGLSEMDRCAFSLMLTCLASSRRFGGEIHIDSIQGENSAAHSCHAVVLAQEVFRRAGLLSNERLNPEVDSLRRSIAIGCLIHDMGEILGELSSLAQRSVNCALQERPDIEREIFRLTLTEAFLTASSKPADPSGFESFIAKLREATNLSEKGIEGTSVERVVDVLRECARIQESRSISPEVTTAVASTLKLYDMAELKKNVHEPQSLFIGNAVKVIEHLQGLRHFMRFARVLPSQHRLHLFSPETHAEPGTAGHKPRPLESVVPLRYISSWRLLGNSQYIEKELPHVFSNASTPHERALAGALRDVAYQSQIEWFSVSRSFIDRTSVGEIPELVSLQKQLGKASSPQERSPVLADIKHVLQGQLNKDRERFLRVFSGLSKEQTTHPLLLPCESRTRIEHLYREALRVGFVPTSETPLLLLDAMPPQLSGFLMPRPEREVPLPPRADAFDGLSMPPPQA